MVAPVGPLATTNCEPRQTRKGAAAAMDSGAGVWRAGVATTLHSGVCYSWNSMYVFKRKQLYSNL